MAKSKSIEQEILETDECREQLFKNEDKPWMPASVREIPSQFKSANFRYRFAIMVNDNIDKKIMEGWQIDQEVGRKMKESGIAFRVANVDGSPLDGTVQIRGQVLMRMPKSVAEKRAKYYEQRSAGAIKSASSELTKAEHAGKSLSYGRVDTTQE